MITKSYRTKDIISKVVDNRGRNTNYYDFEKYPIIDNYMIKNEMHPDLETATRFLSEDQYKSFLRGYIASDDLLMTLVGNGIGNVTLTPHANCAIVQNTIGLAFDKSICNQIYMYYYFKVIQQAIRNLDRGSSQPSINREDVFRTRIQLPIFAVQKMIATILSAYDNLIEVNNKRIKVLEQMAENLYKEWFVRFRFPGHETAEFENGIPKGWLASSGLKPKKWHYGPVAELGMFVRGRNITSDEMVDGQIPVVSAGIEPSGYHNESNVRGKNITISASGANAGYMKYNLEDIWAADCSYMVCNEAFWFIYHSLKFIQPVISNLQCGAAQPHVYPKHINKICIIIPEKKYILNFCNIVSPYYDEIGRLIKQNENLKTQRDLLLPRLMSGKLEV